jgi:hypothetical protein
MPRDTIPMSNERRNLLAIAYTKRAAESVRLQEERIAL